MAKKVKEPIAVIAPKQVIIGNPNAKISLILFGDYESEACAQAHQAVVELLEKHGNEIRFTYRHFPLTKIHQHAFKAAEAAVAAAQEGKFWEMHCLLFQNRKNLGTISLKSYAREAGVMNKDFLNHLINSTYGWEVRTDSVEGLHMGVDHVPQFFINGKKFDGKPSYVALSRAIIRTEKEIIESDHQDKQAA